MTEIKRIWYFIWLSLISYVDPVKNSVKVLVFLGIANFIAGMLSGLICNNEKFQFKKAFRCLIEVAIYVVIVASLFHIGNYMDDGMEVKSVIKAVTYIMLYFYAENILKNLVLLFPGNQVFVFLHFLLALEFVKRVPVFSEILNKKEVKMKVVKGVITSPFGQRIHPITGKEVFHNGVDIACPIGTEILSPVDGEIKSVYHHESGGLTLIIGNDDMRFGFCHLSKVCFPEGVKVTKGSIVALSGNTGKSSGPHCHFTVKINGVWNGRVYNNGEFINPVAYIEL